MNFSFGATTDRRVVPREKKVTNPQAVNSWQATGTSQAITTRNSDIYHTKKVSQ